MVDWVHAKLHGFRGVERSASSCRTGCFCLLGFYEVPSEENPEGNLNFANIR